MSAPVGTTGDEYDFMNEDDWMQPPGLARPAQSSLCGGGASLQLPVVCEQTRDVRVAAAE